MDMVSTIGFRLSDRTPVRLLQFFRPRPHHRCRPLLRIGKSTARIPFSAIQHRAAAAITSPRWDRLFLPSLPLTAWPGHSRLWTRSSRCPWILWMALLEIPTMTSPRAPRSCTFSSLLCPGAARTRTPPAPFYHRNRAGHRMTSHQVYIPRRYHHNPRAYQRTLSIQAGNHVEVCLITSAMS